ncbi:hypothetical protein T552_01689 [Pneumocystis carinii B80]|uniref:C3H1-type domain-containing protein n=1 Tax=Pneumocystis carinii (strain B80) TaxID=1408658 RepID=A0A0W4ZJ92_PNEC8|nr:hypothetical protein T552_01689 [Pneumocystis carinii B80]KTW28428.1 hypothetical protein T552_01689 [Pneumocystis carinii B80]
MEKKKCIEKEKKDRIRDIAILNEIAAVAGAINRHKHKRGEIENKNAENLSFKPHSYLKNPRHRSRHMSLVISTRHSDTNVNNETQSVSTGWIQKKDRHFQLINASIYDSTVKKRVKAIEETRLQKKMKQEEISKKNKYKGARVNEMKELMIDGVKFYVKKNGYKLIRAEDNDPFMETSKKAVVSGSVFWRTKNGNLWHTSLIKSKIGDKSPTKKSEKYCQYYTRTGKCLQGKSCSYKHDPDHVAICPLFMKGKCPNKNACDLSHEPTPHRVSACLHFLRGQCLNKNCLYAHVRVNPSAPICRAFAIDGYCEKGIECREKHLRECPDFSEKGLCLNKNCRLPHIERAARKRKECLLATSDDESSFDFERNDLISNANAQTAEKSFDKDCSSSSHSKDCSSSSHSDLDTFSSPDSSSIDVDQDFIRL